MSGRENGATCDACIISFDQQGGGFFKRQPKKICNTVCNYAFLNIFLYYFKKIKYRLFTLL